MTTDIYYKIIEHKVAHEIIDGEAVVIHFDTGNYYSLNGISSQLWQWLAARATRRQILDAFQPLSPAQIQSFDDFMDSLAAEEVVEKTPAEPGQQPSSPLPAGQVPFELPAFVKYNDMQNLLMSDPIHEVDETGWPHLPEQG